jgi:hypothetical protein
MMHSFSNYEWTLQIPYHFEQVAVKGYITVLHM